jgi:hypothetical protein
MCVARAHPSRSSFGFLVTRLGGSVFLWAINRSKAIQREISEIDSNFRVDEIAKMLPNNALEVFWDDPAIILFSVKSFGHL